MTPAPYILLYRGASWVSPFIRWQTRSRYSHAALCLETREGWRIVEAIEGRGVLCRVLRPADMIEPDWCRVRAFNYPVERWSDERALRLASFALAQVGKPYDWTSVFRFVSRRQASRKSAGVWFCSELVYAAYAEAGIQLLRGCEPWEVSPGLLSRSPLLIDAQPPLVAFGGGLETATAKLAMQCL